MKNELNIYKNYIKECKELERFNIKKYLIYMIIPMIILKKY